MSNFIIDRVSTKLADESVLSVAYDRNDDLLYIVTSNGFDIEIPPEVIELSYEAWQEIQQVNKGRFK